MEENTLTSITVVQNFISALEEQNIDEAISLLSEDCEYDNVPMGKIFGPENIKNVLGPMIERCSTVNWPIYRFAGSGNVVFNERLDQFKIGESTIEVPVCGVWEVHDGKITLWRDYFDLATYQDQKI
tara:strand:- start:196 stop:576 length:381 start_codon:yes stop_codon:yes gene_type:complete